MDRLLDSGRGQERPVGRPSHPIRDPEGNLWYFATRQHRVWGSVGVGLHNRKEVEDASWTRRSPWFARRIAPRARGSVLRPRGSQGHADDETIRQRRRVARPSAVRSRSASPHDAGLEGRRIRRTPLSPRTVAGTVTAVMTRMNSRPPRIGAPRWANDALTAR